MESQPTQPRAPRPAATRRYPLLAAQIVAAIALALVLLHFGVGLARFCRFAITCPYEIDYGEAVLLQGAVNIAQGQVVYNDYQHYPFVVATYPPVYPALCAIGVSLFGVSFAFGRVLSILSALAATALIWLILRRVGTSHFAAGLGAALFLASPVVCLRMPMMRVDMIAVALGLGGLYCVMRGGRWLIAAVALLVLAVYTRQSQVAPLAAGVVYLWWVKERKAAVLVAVSCSALILAGFLALQVASHGWFYRHVVVANRNLWDFGYLRMVWATGFRPWRFPFLLGAVGVALALLGPARSEVGASANPPRRPERLLVLYFALAMLVSLTAGKIGSFVNYLLEPIAAASVMSGVAYHRLAEILLARRWNTVWAAAWLLMVVPPAWVLAQPGRGPCGPYRFVNPDVITRSGAEALPVLRRTRGDVLSEDIGLLLLSGHRVLLDPHKMTSMSEDGTWDQRPLLADIGRRRFVLIITSWDPATALPDQWGCYGRHRWTAGMAQAIKRNYRLLRRAGDLYVLAPADASHPPFDTARATGLKAAHKPSRSRA